MTDRAHIAGLIFAAVLATGVVSAGAETAAPLPQPSCAPSRACAFELARQAGRRNLELTGESFAYELAVIRIQVQQLQAGDTNGARASAVELAKIVDGPGGRDRDGMRSSLAHSQAQVGMQAEALATAKKIRKSEKRDEAHQRIAGALAERGEVDAAFAAARKIDDEKLRALVQQDVAAAAIKTGHRDRIPPGMLKDESALAAHVALNQALESGDLARARESALALPTASARLMSLSMVGQKAVETERWDEVAATVRPMLKDVPNESDFMREIYYELAAEWLTKAGAFEEALAVIPKAGADDRSRLLTELAMARAEAGDIAAAEALLPRIEYDYRKEAVAGIVVGKVLAGKLSLDDALKATPRDELSTSLTTLSELLPDSRVDDVRRALILLAVLEARENVGNDVDYALRDVAMMQARRGFFSDAVETARHMKTSDELLAAYAAAGIEQAKRGSLVDARITFREAEDRARKSGFGPEQHAQLTGALGEAGLLEEAFEQVKSLSLRPKEQYFSEQELDPVLIGLIKRGQPARAYQAAMLLSARESGNPHYFLVIAENSQP